MSDELIEQIKKPIRNQAYCKVSFYIVDPDTEVNISSDSGTNYSDINNLLVDDIVQNFNYATLEWNFWLLDGSQPLYGTTLEDDKQAFISSDLSDENGDFSEYPCITLTSNSYLSTAGLTLTFDSLCKNYATNIYVKAYKDDTLIADGNYEFSSYETNTIFADDNILENWNKIEIYFTSTNIPYRRIRATQLIIGILKVYDDDSIISMSTTEKTSMINSELPTHTLEFTIDNTDKKYNPDNPLGWYQYVQENQLIIYEWGYKLDDGTVEWVVGGCLKSDGSPTVKDTQATFSATTNLNLLTNTYNKGVYNAGGTSLYDLAVDVLTDAGIESSGYSLCDELKNVYTEAPIPQTEHRQALQIIATAGNCTLFEDRYGIITIIPFEYNINNIYWDYDFLTSRPNLSPQPRLGNSIVYLNQYTVSSETSEIYKNEGFNLTTTQDVEITYDLSANQSVSITGGTLNSSNLYGRYGILNITPDSPTSTITLSITGNKITTVQTVDSTTYNSNGTDNEYTNDLITPTLENSKDSSTKTFIGDWYSFRNVYDFDNRGDITVDTRQILNIENEFTDKMIGYLVENNIEYNGGWSADSTVIRISGKRYADLVNYTYEDLTSYTYYELYASDI